MSLEKREDSVWLEEQVVAEGSCDGVHVESVVQSQRTIVRGTFRSTWVYPAGHKLANWKDD
jgi:hypothetical protein